MRAAAALLEVLFFRRELLIVARACEWDPRS
jgi:hypothetical protein